MTTDAGPIAFDALVIAAGAWSRKLLRGLGDDAPLDTERGYHVMMENSIDLRIPLLCADHKFSMTPMTDGIRLGGTVEFAGLEAPPNPKRWDIMAATRARAAAGPQARDAFDLDGIPAVDAGLAAGDRPIAAPSRTSTTRSATGISA